jgi:uncharacterized metal-binding protein
MTVNSIIILWAGSFIEWDYFKSTFEIKIRHYISTFLISNDLDIEGQPQGLPLQTVPKGNPCGCP